MYQQPPDPPLAPPPLLTTSNHRSYLWNPKWINLMTAVGVVIRLCVRTCSCAEFCQMSKNIDSYFSRWNKHMSMTLWSRDEPETSREYCTVNRTPIQDLKRIQFWPLTSLKLSETTHRLLGMCVISRLINQLLPPAPQILVCYSNIVQIKIILT